ncbi:hypothetical protein [Natrinema sp. SYSU A 869]|uniref:hypothetical protein n=1 Tax=Natrinema sp. SYSU A 869 TaxID=2871694 RepID=UPI001CA422AF|nr:hypothetical protein [Natrinema sp. SYSU A 869]
MSTERTRPTSGLDRRSYLKLAGLAVPAAVSSMSVASAADDAESYEVIEARGQTIDIDDGETFANKLIDYTTGEGCTIDARESTDWTIRNVGFRGRKRAPRTVFGLSDTDNGTSTVENVYLGDGSDDVGDSPHGPGGIFVGPEHTGTIEFRNVNVQGFPNNGIYASAPATSGEGSIHIDGCYAANCGVSQYRVGGDDDTIANSTAVLTESGYDGRGVWAWSPGEVNVANCQFAMDGRHYSFVVGANDDSSRLSVTDTEWDDEFHGGWANRYSGDICFDGGNGNDPYAIVPEGCPASVADVFPADIGDIFIADQESTGDAITVGLAFYNAANAVVVVETESGDVVGHSDVIPAGDAVEGLSVELASPLEETQRVTARLHHVTDETPGTVITVDGEPIATTVNVTLNNWYGDYTAEDGVVDNSGLNGAVTDYLANELAPNQLNEIISYYLSGEPMS